MDPARAAATVGGDGRAFLTDNDLMPWGKHKGVKMFAVPASYLHWLWTNERDPMSRKVGTDAVARYIERNMDVLKEEHPDGIW